MNALLNVFATAHTVSPEAFDPGCLTRDIFICAIIIWMGITDSGSAHQVDIPITSMMLTSTHTVSRVSSDCSLFAH